MAQTPSDSFEALLHTRGLSADDLSRSSPTDWLGRSDPATVPFVLPHHRYVQDDPRHLLRLGSNLLTVAGSSVGDVNLVRLLTVFGLQPRLPGFRGLVPPQARSLDLAEVLVAAGVADSKLEIERRVGELPSTLRPLLARLVMASSLSAQRVEQSWAGVDAGLLRQALALPDVPRLLPGASVSWPSLNRLVADGRVPGDVDRAAAMVPLVRAVQDVSEALTAEDWSGVGLAARWRVETRWGRIVVSGPGEDEIDCADCFVAVDLGGDDRWIRDEAKAGRQDAGGPGGTASSPGRRCRPADPPAGGELLEEPPAADERSHRDRRLPACFLPATVVLDLAGDDEYHGSFAAGRGSVAMLADLAGDDRYEATDGALGSGYLGYGLLFDAAGDDRYVARGGAQGAGVFGAGLLVDAAGNDAYSIDGEGQGFGGPGGCGALVDLAGDDAYRAEPDPANATGRADYHSGGQVNASNAQGAGVGRRGDLSDGHLWAGGVGALADVAGDDRYEAGNFAQASGYVYGTGFLLDGGGNDLYRSTYFAQASASHEAAALLLDLAGDDRHELATGAGLGYGWDLAVGLYADLGGSDLYRAEKLALGSADLSSLGVFLELAGDDVYESGGVRTLGAAAGEAPEPRPPHPAGEQVRPLGLFFDLDGSDTYPVKEKCRPEEGSEWTCGAGGFGWDLESAVTDVWTWLFAGDR